jgi:tRNA pseudouridine55 synthase
MSRKNAIALNGWINLDKPSGITSTQAIGKVRRILNPKKIGHAGTLDPLATGVLPLALGEATKTIPFSQDARKAYAFSVKWGIKTDSNDIDGEIISTSDVIPSSNDIQNILSAFTGEIKQTPPIFSAIKVEGKRSYDLARKGEKPKLKARKVHIYKLEMLESDKEESHFYCECSKGTYIRSIARDLGEKLNTYGTITSLRRIRVGNFTEKNIFSLEKLEKLAHSAPLAELLLPVEIVLDDIPALTFSETEATKLKNGQQLTFVSHKDIERLSIAGINTKDETVALGILNDRPLALITIKGPNIKPKRIFNL